jgi:acyl-CoA synthetase (AMP-forming)/AMP-acid ligase II
LLQDAVGADERVLLLLPQGMDFAAAFWGCLYAGRTAVPASLPHPALLKRALPRLEAIVEDARPGAVMTTRAEKSLLEPFLSSVPALARLRWIELDGPAAARSWREPALEDGSLAFLQYTSGSTAAPKGVMVTHGNLTHNNRMILDAFRTQPVVGVCWLPMTHDMSLIGNVLHPVFAGGRCYFMSPLAFLQKPSRWLSAISRFGGTVSGGPSFAFEHCVDRIPEEERAGLKLDRWQLAYCGSEPVRRQALERFARAFAPYGFSEKALYPCYGLAESTLIVSGGEKGSGLSWLTVDREDLARGEVRVVREDDARGWTLVGCGRTRLDLELLIVDPGEARPLPEGRVGEIWVRGASVARGYWGKTGEAAEDFEGRLATGEGPFLRTGDLGFVRDGQLYPTGRLKDVIIIRGFNHHPEDLERTVEGCHASIRKSGCAAFSVESAEGERLIVAVELDKKGKDPVEPLKAAVREAVLAAHQLRVHEVLVVKSGALPKTTSGKIRRRSCREEFLAGRLTSVA